MDAEMAGILSRADELLHQLKDEYVGHVKDMVVTERAKNLFHETLLKIRTSLEFLMRRTFDNYSRLSDEKKQKAMVYFPICDSEDDFRRKLKRVGLDNLHQDNLELYERLRSAQPYSSERKDLVYLRELTNLGKHVRLAAQECSAKPATQVTGPSGTVTYTKDVTFRSMKIMGAPLDPKTQRIKPIPGVSSKEVTLVSFDVEGYKGPDPVLFCTALLQGTRRFVEKCLPLL